MQLFTKPDTLAATDTAALPMKIHMAVSETIGGWGIEPSPVWTVLACLLGVAVGVAILRMVLR